MKNEVDQPTRTLRTCKQGHRFYKSSDCPTCPKCEQERLAKDDFMPELSAPARRALANAGIHAIRQLAAKTEKEILGLHGMGKASLPKMRTALATAGLTFKK